MSDLFCDEILDIGEIDGIERVINNRFPFPVVNVSDICMTLNRHAVAMLGETDFYSIGVTSEYVVIRPEKTRSHLSFAWGKNPSFTYGKNPALKIPSRLRQKKLAQGVHRVFKYKDGIVFKRYETIGDEDE